MEGRVTNIAVFNKIEWLLVSTPELKIIPQMILKSYLVNFNNSNLIWIIITKFYEIKIEFRKLVLKVRVKVNIL